MPPLRSRKHPLLTVLFLAAYLGVLSGLPHTALQGLDVEVTEGQKTAPQGLSLTLSEKSEKMPQKSISAISGLPETTTQGANNAITVATKTAPKGLNQTLSKISETTLQDLNPAVSEIPQTTPQGLNATVLEPSQASNRTLSRIAENRKKPIKYRPFLERGPKIDRMLTKYLSTEKMAVQFVDCFEKPCPDPELTKLISKLIKN